MCTCCTSRLSWSTVEGSRTTLPNFGKRAADTACALYTTTALRDLERRVLLRRPDR